MMHASQNSLLQPQDKLHCMLQCLALSSDAMCSEIHSMHEMLSVPFARNVCVCCVAREQMMYQSHT